MLDLKEVLQNVKKWSRDVGDFQKDYFGKKDLLINTKSSHVDLVTEADKACEEYILDKIKKNYPNHSILSEETGKSDKESDYLWIIDPIDGTTNFAQGLPIFSISIALQYKNKSVLGVIYVPMLNEMFEAINRQGAFLNGKRISVSDKRLLKNCVLGTGFPYDKTTHTTNNSKYFSQFVTRTRGLRRMGVASYDLANVACGRLDGFWEINLSRWDVAAGTLIVKEAGGKIVYLTEKRGISIVAGNNVICDKIIEEINKVDSNR